MQETRPLAAAAAMLGAMVIIGYIDNFVVVIAENHGLWQFQVLRSAMTIPLILALVMLGMGTMRANSLRAVMARSFLISFAMMIYFGALAFMPIAEVAAGLFTSPIWVMVISVLFLGHRIGPVRSAMAVIGFVGVVLVLQPETGGMTWASAVPVMAGLFYAIGAIATRQWCEGESALSLLTGNFVAMAILAGIGLAAFTILGIEAPSGPDGFLSRGWVALDGPFLFWTFVQAAGSVIGVWLIIRSYQLGEVSFSASFEYSLLVFVAFWAWILRGETLDLLSIIGIALIIGSGAVIAIRGR